MANLKSLALLRNDPEAAESLIREAEQADVDAQYAAGLIYAEGRGVEQSDALAYFWLTLAMEQGDADAELLRMVILSRISEQDIEFAKHLLDKLKTGQYQMKAELDRQ